MLPELLQHGGSMMWLLLFAGAVAVAVFAERMLYCHRQQINSLEFLNGVRNVLKKDNVVEALSICDATPGPVARLVKVAILNRDRSLEAVREAVKDAGALEVPRLEDRLTLLATIGQIAPMLGLLGTVLGFIEVFRTLQTAGVAAPPNELARGVWMALVSTAGGLALAIPCYAGYNYLVSRVGKIVQDMEKSSVEILTMIAELQNPK